MTSAVHAGSARAAPDSISLGEPVGTSPLDERKKARAVVVGMWCAYITLMVGVFTLERGSLLELHKREQDAALTAATVTAAALVTRVALVGTPARRTAQGVTIVAYSVTAVSTVTNWILGTFPSPVVVDHFTQCRVHLVRWCVRACARATRRPRAPRRALSCPLPRSASGARDAPGGAGASGSCSPSACPS